VKGDVRPDEPTLVRPHLEYLPGTSSAIASATRGASSRKRWSGSLPREGRDPLSPARRPRARPVLHRPGDSARAPSTALTSWLQNFREFGIGAQILRDVGVGKIRWLTNRPLRLVSLPGYGLEIIESVPLTLDDPNLSSASPRSGKLLKLR